MSSYSVEALLKARDAGFSSAFKAAQKSVSNLTSMAGGVGSAFKSVLGANLISSAITNGISAITSGIGSMASELNNSQKAWKTFEGNLQAFGRSAEVIAGAKKEMQDFATKTIYSASDMASTYSQLDAVGTKNVGSLVKAFGGLAASAENPAQAMKSLSTQATQMASKPTVAWMDFKIMMEQAPAGMAAVAKQMGISTAELVAQVQDKKITTEAFFDAMNKAGNSVDFQKMATEFKTVDQAIDGAKESLSNKLMPAFEHLNKFGIKSVNALSDAVEKINFDKLAATLGKSLEQINVDKVLASVQASFNRLQGMIKTVFNESSMSGFVGAIRNARSAIDVMNKTLIGGSGITGWLLIARNGFQTLASIINNGAMAVKAFMATFGQIGAILAIKTAISDTFNTIRASLSTLNKTEIFGNLGKSFGSAVAKISQAWSNMVKTVNWNQLVSGASNVLSIIANLAGTVIPVLLNAFTAVANIIGAITNSGSFVILTSVIQSVVSVVGSLASAFTGLFSGISSGGVDLIVMIGLLAEVALRGLGTGGVLGALKLIPGALGGVISKIPFVGTAFSKVAGIFQRGGKTAGDALGDVAKKSGGTKSIVSQVFNGLSNVIKSFGTSIKTAATGIGTMFKSLGTGFATAVKGIGSAIKMLNPAQMLAFGGSIAIASVGIGAGIALIASGFALLGSQSKGISAIITSLGTAITSVVTGAITALANAFVTVAPVLPPIIAAFSNLGPVIMSFGIAAATVIGAIGTLGPVIESIGVAISTVVTAIGGAVSQIVTAVTPIVQIVSDTFVQIVSVVSNAIVQIVQALAPFIPAITEMVIALAPVLQSIVEAFNNLISQISPIIDSITQLFKTLGQQISQILDSASGVIESFGSAIRNVLDGVAGIFESMGNAAKNAGQGVKLMAQGIKMLVDLRLGDLVATLGATATGLGSIASHANGMTMLGTSMTLLGTGMTMFATSAVVAITSLSTFGLTMSTLQAGMALFPTVMLSAAAGFSLFTAQAVGAVVGLSAINAPIAMFNAQIMTVTSALMMASTGFAGFGFSILTASASLGIVNAIIGSLVSQLSSVSSAVSSTVASFQSMTQAQAIVKSVMDAVVTIIHQGSTQMAIAANGAGNNITRNMASAMSSSQASVTGAMQSIVSAVKSTAMTGVGSMRSIGSYIGQGLAEGMYSALGAVTAAANALVEQAERAARAKAQIHSPSRLFRDNVGIFIGQGVAVGIDNSKKYVNSAMDSMFDGINSFSLQVGELMSDNLAYSFEAGRTTSSVDVTYRREDSEQLGVIREALSTIKDMVARDVVLNVDSHELARTTGGAMTSYQQQRTKIDDRMRGLVNV